MPDRSTGGGGITRVARYLVIEGDCMVFGYHVAQSSSPPVLLLGKRDVGRTSVPHRVDEEHQVELAGRLILA
jgi:hypothetical protein